MTRIKFCGLKMMSDIYAANDLRPEYIGFVFVNGSRRSVTKREAAALKKALYGSISAVGVFADEKAEAIAALMHEGIIDMAQLHGNENEEYIARLRSMTGRPVIRAFKIKSREDILTAEKSGADHILLDAGAGEGRVFDWNLVKGIKRDYFLAGGLSVSNVRDAVEKLHPFAVDVSSGIETNGLKDKDKMEAFAYAVRR